MKELQTNTFCRTAETWALLTNMADVSVIAVAATRSRATAHTNPGSGGPATAASALLSAGVRHLHTQVAWAVSPRTWDRPPETPTQQITHSCTLRATVHALTPALTRTLATAMATARDPLLSSWRPPRGMPPPWAYLAPSCSLAMAAAEGRTELMDKLE